MSSPALQRPLAPSAPAAPPPLPPRRPQRRSQRRVLAAGLAASLAVHALVLLLSRYLITTAVPYSEAGSATPAQRTSPPGIRVYRIEPVAEAAAPPEEQVAQQRLDVPTRVPVPPAAAEAEAAPSAGEGEERAGRALSPAERLRPRAAGDARLWAPLPLLVERPASPAEAARENLYTRMNELSDSLALEAGAARRAMDWTFKGPDGKRWGISPEGIHLGGITLPAPSLGPPPARLREWEEIQGQADRARIRDRFDERAREIRERKERERQQNKKGEQGKEEEEKEPPPS